MQNAADTAKMQIMAVSITIRDVPEAVRNELAARAARAGQSLQEYVRALLVAHAGKPDMAELMARVEAELKATGRHVPADVIVGIIREGRGELPGG